MLIKYLLLEVAFKIPIITYISNTILGDLKASFHGSKYQHHPWASHRLRNKQTGQEKCDGIG